MDEKKKEAETKFCKRCQTAKPLSEFSIHKREKDGLYYLCKVCARIKHPRELKYLPCEVQPTPAQAAWAAGFIDAEGSFCIIRTGMQYPIVSVYNNKPEPLKFLQTFLGGKLEMVKRQKRSENHADSYQLVFINRGVILDVCKKVHPYLILKKQQCELVMRACSTPRPERMPLIDEINRLNNQSDQWTEEMKVSGKRTDLEQVTELSWHYLAGYIEGDGNFSMRPWHDSLLGYEYQYPEIRVYSTRYPALKWMIDTFGGNLKWRDRAKEGWEPEGTVVFVDSKHVKQVLEKLLPCFVYRRAEAEILLNSLQVEAKDRQPFADQLDKLKNPESVVTTELFDSAPLKTIELTDEAEETDESEDA